MRKLEPANVVIFVKEPPSPRVLESARKKCGHVVYDPIDNYRFDLMRGLEVDAVMACNSVHADRLLSVVSCKFCHVVPHHHCMIGKAAVACDNGPRVGYVGDDVNLGIDPALLGPGFVHGLDLSILGRIGIGIAYRPEGEARLYKSGVKLANYWAHSVAAVCSPDASYLEMGKDGEDMLVARSADDVIRLAGLLVADASLRMSLVRAGARKASDYGMGKIRLKYLEMLGILKEKTGDSTNAKKET